MDNIKNVVIGGLITLVVGGTAFTFSQETLINNFAQETGLTQEQAEQYVNNVLPEELVPFAEVGEGYIAEGKETLRLATEIDCVNYEYEWESSTLSCTKAKAQLETIGNSEQSLGRALVQLSAEGATEADMLTVISYIDRLNADYSLEASVAFFDGPTLDEIRMTNSYNKSLLKAALDSN